MKIQERGLNDGSFIMWEEWDTDLAGAVGLGQEDVYLLLGEREVRMGIMKFNLENEMLIAE